jgi:hypothetical protein
MWTVIALFCSLTEPNKGVCVPATPPIVFETYEQCMGFAAAETTRIALDAVSYDYQCVQWNNKT